MIGLDSENIFVLCKVESPEFLKTGKRIRAKDKAQAFLASLGMKDLAFATA